MGFNIERVNKPFVVKSPYKPSGDQPKAIEELATRIENGENDVVLMGATGTGKTVTAVMDAKRFGKRTLFLAHTVELVDQATKAFRELWPRATVGRYVESMKQGNAFVVCGSIQSVALNLERFKPDDFGYIIVDEAHHASADTYQKVLSYFTPEFTLGLTATPERADDKNILDIFKNTAHKLDIQTAVEIGELVPVRCIRIHTNIDLTKVRFNSVQYNIRDLESKIYVPERNQLIVDTWLQYVKDKRTVIFCASVKHAQEIAGQGVAAQVDGALVLAGNAKLMQTLGVAVPQKMASSAEALAAQGKTPLFFAKDGTMQGVIAVADVIKEDSPQAVRELQGMGIRVVMLTGDNERTAKAIGAQAGVDEVIAGVLPDGKEAVIRSLKNKGRVAMVGDGINDAPALTRADVGIAIGAGTDVAIDAADVVLMKSRLSDVPAAIRLSRATLHNIHENLFWAFAYNVLGIPLAAGVFIPLLHWQMNPMYGAAAMSLSSFCVVSNALRLNLFDIRSTKHDHKRKAHKTSKKENTTMNKTIKIEGMMCGHCEATVKKALEALDGVSAAEVSHTAGTAVVTLDKPVDDTVLKKAVEDKDYTVTGIE